MANKFNQFGSSGDSNVINGSLDIYGYSLRAENLNPNEPLKTNSIGQLISSNLNISDVNNLQTELDATIQTPYTDGDIQITNGNLIAKDIVTDTILSLNTSISNLESNVSDKLNKSGDTMSGNLDMGGNSMTNVFSIAVDEINEKTLGNGIYTIDTLYTTDVIVTGGSKIKTDNLEEATQNDGINILSTLHMNGGTIDGVFQFKADEIGESTLTAGVTMLNTLYTNEVVVTGSNQIKTDNIAEATGANGIDVLSDIHMNSKTIDQVFDVRSDRVTCGQFQELTPGNGINIQNTEVYAINDTNPLVTNHFSIIDNFGNNANLRIISQSAVSSLVQEPTNFTIASNQNINILSGGAKDVTIGTSDGAKTILIDDSLGEVILNSLNLDMNSNNIVNCNNIQTASINNVVQVRSVSDLPTAALGFHKLVANTQYVIIGSVTLTNGFDFSNGGCAVTGVDMGTSTVIFNESANDITGFYGRDANIYVSNLTISGGGGRFADSVDGLFDCADYDLAAPAPFYGRNRRFRVQSCNILSAYRLGRVVGFGTLNCNNNFINGGGGGPSGVYTIEGFRFSGGLSLEFIGNKVVLFAGAQIANSGALLRLENNVSPVLNFNAVVISSNIIHPRSTETGITFDAGSRTELGAISGNTLIRTGGSGALLDYSDISLYNNYNPLSVKNYSINGNAGIVDSEPNLKSAIGNSVATTVINPSRAEIVPTFNDQVFKIDSSSRFAVQVDMTGGTQAFVVNERMTDAQLGTNFLILAVETAVGVSPNITQTVYVIDMSGTPQQTPNPVGGWTSPSGGSFTTASFTYRYRYSEKDPRKLVTVATFSLSTGTNETYFVAPGNGVADANCEVSGVSNNLGVGGTVSLSCTRVFNNGDIINFFVSSTGGSPTSIVKGIINIK